MAPFAYQLAGLSLHANVPLGGLAVQTAGPAAHITITVLGQRSTSETLAWQHWEPWGPSEIAAAAGLLRASDSSGDWYCFSYRADTPFPGAFANFVLGPGGRRIWVEWNNPTVDEPTALALLSGALNGRVLGYALRLQGRIVLHASVVAVDGWGVLLMGQPGAGKSTLASVLGAAGHAILADDAALLTEADEQWLVWPGLQQMRLTPDSLALFGAATSVAARPIPYEGKLLVPADRLPGAAAGQRRTPVPAGMLYVLGPRVTGDKPHFRSPGPAECLKLLLDQRYGIAGPSPQLLATEALRLGRLASRLPLARLQLPDDLRRLPALSAAVAAHARAACRRDDG